MMFFEDDDEDDNEKMQKEKAIDLNDDDEDPLDAYMRTLKDKNRNTTSSANNNNNNNENENDGRLDVECDDEATSHWVIRNNGSFNETRTNHENPMGNAFQKASNEQYAQVRDGSREVDIHLQQVKHDEVEYQKFEKRLLPINFSDNDRNTVEGHKWKKENLVTCDPSHGSCPLDPIYDLAELREILPEAVMRWNVIKNHTQPTLVQSQTLGVALCGKDAIITAPTGSGKTLSYLWPISSHLMINRGNGGDNCSRALVLLPTRELALQVESIAKSMFTKLPLIALAITGGNMGRYQLSQKLQSKKPHCVIATPGRLLDVLNSQQKMKQEWLLRNITFLVLDEADKMIQLGFANQVTQVLKNLRPDRQSLLVSATFDKKLQRRCQEWMNEPYRISIGNTGESSKHVTQHAICLPNAQAKLMFLKESIPDFVGIGRTLVFCATRQGVEIVAKDMRKVIPVEILHGDRHASDRNSSLKAFAKGDVKVLVATDIAGRGLDIPHVATIINYDPAKNWSTHVHRVGRAGRLSANDDQQVGSAYTLLLPSDVDFAKAMIRAYEREKRSVPAEVLKLAEGDKTSGKRFRYSVPANDCSIETQIKKGRWS